MNQDAQEARRIYKREWARRNPDKCRQYQERYWERQAQKMREKQEGAAIEKEATNDE